MIKTYRFFLMTAGSLLFFLQPALADISQMPLSMTTGGLANVLVILDNSNSMDEDASGTAVGSDSEESKSEIARSAVKTLIETYQGELNMGLMAYKQQGVSRYSLHNSPYDVSYDPSNYDAGFDGDRDSATKKYSMTNPTDSSYSIYYNVALPFYSSSSSGTRFCYSKNADFPGTANSSSHQYTCWTSKTGTSDTIPNSNNEAQSYGYTGSRYSGNFSPTDSDIAQSIYDFGQRMMWTYVGKTWYANSSPGRGYLHVPISLLNDDQAELLNTKLATSQFSTNRPTDADYPLQNAGLTPMEGTLQTALDYFEENWSNTSEGYSSACYPLPESCENNFVILVTDGLPSIDKSGNTTSDADQALEDSAEIVEELADAGITTYIIGFAMPYGTDEDTLDILAEAGETDEAILAEDEETLTEALEDIFNNIKKATSSAAALAANSTQLQTEGSDGTTYLYQVTFNSTDWSGALTAYPLATDGTVEEATWSTDDSGVIPAAAGKQIYTWTRTTSDKTGIEFTEGNLTELTQAQQEALNSDSDLLNWVRGDSSNEDDSNFRVRDSPVGDIIDSAPVYVASLDFSYDSLSSSVAGQSTYNDFVATLASKTPMIYVGANDGMLHALEVDSSASTAKEIFAYIPEAVFDNLASLASPAYDSSTHQFFVDGSPVAYHAYIDSSWRTILLCTTGRGGQSIFALDITDPDNFDEDDVLWEYNTEDDKSGDLGYLLGEPVLAHLANDKWGVIFGNGYESDNSLAYLYVLDAESGELMTKIATSSATGNGLSTPSVLVDSERTVSNVYAGDLLGNIWKFDFSDNKASEWSVEDNSNGANPLFTARYDSDQVQPITAPLEISEHDNGGYMIYFGTGQYYETGDNSVPDDPEVQSLYAIWDDEENRITTLDRSTLMEQSILYELESNDSTYRITSYIDETEFNWSAEDNEKTQGWFMDLISPENGKEGERVVTTAVLRNDRAIFTTLIPTQETCSAGGSSWLMELDAETGNRLTSAAFDVDGDGDVDTDDMLMNLTVSGVKTDAISTTPTIITDPDGDPDDDPDEYKYITTSDGTVTTIVESGGDEIASGRRSWRQVQE